MKKQQKWLALAVVLVGVGQRALWAANTPADGTITVTPLANVSLALAPTTYAYGQLAVNISSVSATALTLSNNGDVDVTVDKRIQSDGANWIGDTSNATPNHYVLYVATSVARPVVGDFTAADHRFGAVSNVSNLKGSGGGSPLFTTSGGATPSADLWFRLDTPQTITTAAAQTITVRFTGTAQ